MTACTVDARPGIRFCDEVRDSDWRPGGEDIFWREQSEQSVEYWTTHQDEPETEAQFQAIMKELVSVQRALRKLAYTAPDWAELRRSKTPTVHVLQVDRDPANLAELEAGLTARHTMDGWQMPKGAKPGDVAVWYATLPTGAYVAWGWVEEAPQKVDDGHSPYRGPVKAMRSLLPPVSRVDVFQRCGVDGGIQSYQTLKGNAPGFLEAVGLGLISEAVSEVVSALG